MARAFVLGNGRMLVNLDDQGQVRDYYFPYVGLENHTGGLPHKLGIWVDGIFSWFDTPEWQKVLTYETEALTTDIIGHNSKLELEIQFNDIVDHAKNIFLRKVTLKNLSKRKRNIRFFFHQIFIILESPFEDTVYYHPELQALIHYKDKRYFLINACFANETKSGIYNYSCGLASADGKSGTYKEAENGVLNGVATRHGLVDSTLSMHFTLEPGKDQVLCYWICVGKDIFQVERLNLYVLKKQYWITQKTKKESKKWVNRTPLEFRGLSEPIVKLFKRSLLIARAHADQDGAIIASCDSRIIHDTGNSYSHVWPRDGSLITLAFNRGGYIKTTKKFFKFCAKAITPKGYLFHKYLSNGSRASSWSPWFDQDGNIQLPIQEDETAIVLDALLKYYLLYKDKDFIQKLYANFIVKAGQFLLTYKDPNTGLPKQSYDLWEEKLGIHTYTCCTIYAGFQALAFFEELLGNVSKAQDYKKAAEDLKQKILYYFYDETEQRFIKGLYLHKGKFEKDMTIDASNLYGIFTFKVLLPEDQRVISTFEITKKKLSCPHSIGGFARYENDVYYQKVIRPPGNPWFITTLWIAEYYVARATNQDDLKPAIDIFQWVTRYALSTGILSEQIDITTGEQLSASPLTWSHAAYATAIMKYLEKLDELKICPICAPVVES